MQFVVSGSSVSARDFVLDIFQRNQWRVNLISDWAATAEHGDAAGSIFGGAFVGVDGRHVVFNITFSLDPQGYTLISLLETTSGLSGGAIGVSQAKTIYQSMYDNVGIALTNAGIFIANTKILT